MNLLTSYCSWKFFIWWNRYTEEHVAKKSHLWMILLKSREKNSQMWFFIRGNSIFFSNHQWNSNCYIRVFLVYLANFQYTNQNDTSLCSMSSFQTHLHKPCLGFDYNSAYHHQSCFDNIPNDRLNNPGSFTSTYNKAPYEKSQLKQHVQSYKDKTIRSYFEIFPTKWRTRPEQWKKQLFCVYITFTQFNIH